MLTRNVFAALVGLASASVTLSQEKEAPITVTAIELTKAYATDPAEFDKKFKGKMVVVEGTVVDGRVVSGKSRYCVLAGYTKPGESYGPQVNCAINEGFEGVRIGHKLQIRGTCQPHSPTRLAAALENCSVVKVDAADFPPSKEVAAEIAKLQGKWKVTGVEGAGKFTANQLGVDEFSVDGYQMTWTAATGKKDGVTSRQIIFGLALDPATKLKEMTLHLRLGPLPGVYELTGDRLRICVPLLTKSLKDAKRPAKISGGGEGEVVISAERQK